jgi:hypothetical protein
LIEDEKKYGAFVRFFDDIDIYSAIVRKRTRKRRFA